jgi:hypothetical protein
MSAFDKGWLTDRKLLFTTFTLIGAVAAAIGYFLIIPTANYHFQEVILNFYENHSTDFSVDVTVLVRGLGVVALACMALGLIVGTLIGLRHTGILLETKEGHFAPDAKIDVLLLKSGLVSGVATHEGVKFELTDRGRQFMQEYEKNEHEPQGPTPRITKS